MSSTTFRRLGQSELLPRYIFAESLFVRRRVLEIGAVASTGGRSAQFLAERGARQVLACDDDVVAVEEAQKAYGSGAVRFRAAIFDDLELHSFDLVIVADFARYVRAPELMKELAQLVAKNGYLLGGLRNPAGLSLSQLLDPEGLEAAAHLRAAPGRALALLPRGAGGHPEPGAGVPARHREGRGASGGRVARPRRRGRLLRGAGRAGAAQRAGPHLDPAPARAAGVHRLPAGRVRPAEPVLGGADQPPQGRARAGEVGPRRARGAGDAAPAGAGEDEGGGGPPLRPGRRARPAAGLRPRARRAHRPAPARRVRGRPRHRARRRRRAPPGGAARRRGAAPGRPAEGGGGAAGRGGPRAAGARPRRRAGRRRGRPAREAERRRRGAGRRPRPDRRGAAGAGEGAGHGGPRRGGAGVPGGPAGGGAAAGDRPRRPALRREGRAGPHPRRARPVRHRRAPQGRGGPEAPGRAGAGARERGPPRGAEGAGAARAGEGALRGGAGGAGAGAGRRADRGRVGAGGGEAACGWSWSRPPAGRWSRSRSGSWPPTRPRRPRAG